MSETSEYIKHNYWFCLSEYCACRNDKFYIECEHRISSHAKTYEELKTWQKEMKNER